jgi:hypothetical protein
MAVLGAIAAGTARADVVTLKDGDRVHGKTVARGTKRLRLQTAYGLLIIPLEKIDKITHDDGTEEVVGAPAAPIAAPTPPPPPPAAKLSLIVTGKTFWYAWDPKEPPADPSLRLEVRLDEQTIAAYVDGQADEGEIPGALVNAFSFAPEAVTAVAGPESRVLLPENRPGRISLAMEVPVAKAGDHKLRLAYQVNEATKAAPAWREIAGTTLDVTLRADAPLAVDVEQDMGRLEYRRKQMRKLETVRIAARPE